MIFRQLFDHESYTYTYLIADGVTKEAIIIDPVLGQFDMYEVLIRELDLKLKYAVDTHVHADHVTALGALRDKLGAVSVLGHGAGADCVDRMVKDGEVLSFGQYDLQAIATPGHTSESYSFFLKTVDENMVFTGDTLLIRGTGRTDFQNGDPSVQYDSLENKLLSLSDTTIVYPAHDYKGWTRSTIGEEKAHNPRLQMANKAAYVTLMVGLNLPDPKFMDVAVPANMACGRV